MGYRFFSVPVHQLAPVETFSNQDQLMEVELSPNLDVVEAAFLGIEFRHERAMDRLRNLTSTRSTYAPLNRDTSASAIFAAPPADLPALLRMAGQLEDASDTQKETGEKAQIWKCQCGTRYAVPVSLVRTVSIVCEKCQQTVPLHVSLSTGQESLLEPFDGTVNVFRQRLAEFFRESMARGWPVLVCRMNG